MKRAQDFGVIYLHRDPIDFRKGIYRLSEYIQGVMLADPFDGTLFLFVNRKKDAIKAIYWDQTGFALWYKVLDREKFAWPKKVESEHFSITDKQLEWLLSGLDILKMKPHRELHFQHAV